MSDFKDRLVAELDKLDWPNVSTHEYHQAAERITRELRNAPSALDRADWERKRRQEEGN